VYFPFTSRGKVTFLSSIFSVTISGNVVPITCPLAVIEIIAITKNKSRFINTMYVKLIKPIVNILRNANLLPFKRMTAKEHYDQHLGNFYAWMTGDFEQNQLRNQEIFKTWAITPRQNSLAFDLGSGHGIQSVALAQLGFNVTAIDFNRQLLQELKSNAGNLAIRVVEDDILNFTIHITEKPELIVCMGDTLTHLNSMADVIKLFTLAYESLPRGGRLILSFRDLTNELEGISRFIPVKSDDERILTCFLEYFDDKVMVHDILYERHGSNWIQKISAYPKLRISRQDVSTMLSDIGFVIELSSEINRMQFVIASKNITR
jgi:SAM-dependent methyltransferase